MYLWMNVSFDEWLPPLKLASLAFGVKCPAPIFKRLETKSAKWQFIRHLKQTGKWLLWYKMFFRAFPGLIFLIFFCAIERNVKGKNLLMVGHELWISGNESHNYANCTTTTAQNILMQCVSLTKILPRLMLQRFTDCNLGKTLFFTFRKYSVFAEKPFVLIQI